MAGREIRCSILGGYCSKKDQIPLLPAEQVFYSYNVKAKEDRFGSDLKKLVEKAAKRVGYEFCTFEHAETPSTDFLCEKICLQIRRSAILIADVSYYDDQCKVTSPNVAHEIGIAHGVGCKVLLVTTKHLSFVPSNIKSLDILQYPQEVRDERSRLWKILRNQKLTIFPEIEVIPDARLFQKFCKQLEEFEEERMFVSSYIPSMTRERPLSLDEAKAKELFPFRHDLPYLKEYLELINERLEIFEDNLSSGKLKCREVYCKRCVELYAKEGTFHSMHRRKDPASEVEIRIETLINRLKKYEKKEQIYSIRLVDTEPPHKFFLKKNSCVIVDTPTRRIGKRAGGIITTIRPVVETYQKIFERLWDEAAKWDNAKVKEWLEGLRPAIKARS